MLVDHLVMVAFCLGYRLASGLRFTVKPQMSIQFNGLDWISLLLEVSSPEAAALVILPVSSYLLWLKAVWSIKILRTI